MECLSSKKLSHTDGLSKLIPKFCEPLEDWINSTIKAENEIKKCIVQYSVRTAHNIRGGARGVMVIVVGIGHDDTSSNPGRD